MALSRTLAWSRVGAVILSASLALIGCGGNQASRATTSTKATDSPSSSQPTPTDNGQVVSVTKYGVSFEVPKGWISLSHDEVLKGRGANPLLKDGADRVGMTPEQLRRLLRARVETVSVSGRGAQHGFVDNINSVGQDGDLSDDELRAQLATAGASTGPPRHSTSPAGDVTLINTTFTPQTGLSLHGVTLAVHTGEATLVITATSPSDQRADKFAYLILGSLGQLPSATS